MPIYPPRDRSEDIGLSDALRDRRPGAAGRVYDAYGPRLHGYAEGLLKDGDLAARAVRGAMLATRVKAAEVPDVGRFRAWLYALVRTECLSRLGDGGPQDRQTPASAPKGNPENGRTGFSIELETSNELEHEAAGLMLDHGLSIIEVAEVLGVTTERVSELQGRVKVTFSGPLTAKARRPENGAAARNVIKGPWSAMRRDSGDLAAERPPANKPAGQSKSSPPRGGHRLTSRTRRKRVRRVWTTAGSAAFAAAGLVVFLVVLLTSGRPDGGGNGDPSPQLAAPKSNVTPSVAPGATTPAPGPSGPGPGPSQNSQPPGSPGNPGTPTSPADPSRPGDPPGNPPPTKKPAPNPPPVNTNGRLAISDDGCKGVTAHTPRSCQVTLTAIGGAVRWAVSSVNSNLARMTASGGGTLSSGRSTSVTVTVSPTVSCYARGFGNGTVGFSPGGVASISYKCW